MLGLPGIQWHNTFIWVLKCVYPRWSRSEGSSERIARVSLGWVFFKSKETGVFSNMFGDSRCINFFAVWCQDISPNIETNFWPVVSHLVLFSLGRWSRHIKAWSLGLFYIFNVGVVGLISPPLCAEHILYCTWKKKTHPHTPQLHSCEGGRGPMRLMRHRGSREGSIVRGSHRRLSGVLSPFTLCGVMTAW